MDREIKTASTAIHPPMSAFTVADMCMQIRGGTALTTDLPIEKFWRQQRSSRTTGGATEVMKMVIARHVLKTSG
jgi:acyl-CoA dehydrogenase